MTESTCTMLTILSLALLIAIVLMHRTSSRAWNTERRQQREHQARVDMSREETIRLQALLRALGVGEPGRDAQRISRYPNPPPAPPMPPREEKESP